eukprot:Phypoly_transcript_20909.p1 GENE.Phypoly_transcript_20909~~Phypoly_transcript_20909.p1  ORF type:complete len:138 (+),score=10.62 Phypoly_transcript_20909:187-600(+)
MLCTPHTPVFRSMASTSLIMSLIRALPIYKDYECTTLRRSIRRHFFAQPSELELLNSPAPALLTAASRVAVLHTGHLHPLCHPHTTPVRHSTVLCTHTTLRFTHARLPCAIPLHVSSSCTFPCHYSLMCHPMHTRPL